MRVVVGLGVVVFVSGVFAVVFPMIHPLIWGLAGAMSGGIAVDVYDFIKEAKQ